MADGVQVTEGSGKTIATQERSGPIHIQQFLEIGASDLAVGRVSVTSSGATVVSARANRRRVTIQSIPANTVDVDIGPSGTVSGAGFLLTPGDAVDIAFVGTIVADVQSGTAVLSFMDEYDA